MLRLDETLRMFHDAEFLLRFGEPVPLHRRSSGPATGKRHEGNWEDL